MPVGWVARAVLFIDGDMTGRLSGCCARLLSQVAAGHDLTLTNCYPYMGYRSHVAKQVLDQRERLNRVLGVFTQLGLATPSHGPHCVSRRLLETVEIESLAVPPLELAQAVEKGLRIKVAATLAADQWSSAQRGRPPQQLDRGNHHWRLSASRTVFPRPADDAQRRPPPLYGLPPPERSGRCRQPVVSSTA